MKTMTSRIWGLTQVGLRVAVLVLIILQCSVLTARASKNIYVRWGTDSNWNGDGGSVTSPGKVVQNERNISPKAGNTETITFTLTPITGYVIDLAEWKDGDGNGFNYGSGTTLTPNAANQVTFTLTGDNCSFQVRFKVDPNAATSRFVSYYGTGPIDNTAATPPNWIGGSAARWNGSTWDTIGTSSYITTPYPSNGTKTVKITPTTSPAYTITAVQYCEANWNDPRNVTVTPGTCVSTSADTDGYVYVPATQPKNYIVFVQFSLIGAQGGNIGAWYGSNNTLDYDASTAIPPGANGSGGTVWKTSPGSTVQFPNRNPNGVTVTSNSTVSIEARPDVNFKITSIYYGDTNPTSSVSVPPNQTTPLAFTFPVANGHNYKVWVVFESTAASSFNVTGTIDMSLDPGGLCTSNSISPASQTVNINQTGTFALSTSANCTIDSVSFNGGGFALDGISGATYTTPPITATSSFVVRLKPIGYNIVSEIDATSPSGCGSISPVGTTAAIRGSNVAYAITVNVNCAISHVWVTDTNNGYLTDTDIAPLPMPAYTFNNLQADGHIKVAFTNIVPTSSDAYCQIPPFVAGQTGLVPNVLIIFDNSGSMGGNDTDGYAYYNNKTYNCTSTSTPGSCTTFYGYFDPAKMYKTAVGDSNKYLIDNVTLNLSSSNGKSGNYLNYRYMHKVDIVRKALMGGKIVNRAVVPTADPLTHYFLAADIGKTIQYGTELPTGMVQNLSGKVRFGVMVFNNPAEGGHLAIVPGTSPARRAVLGSSENDLIRTMESSETDPTTSTPIAETLYEAIRYFQAKPSAYNSGTDYGTMDPIQNTCQKNFILLLTDGEPNSNNNLPGLSTHPTMNGYTDSVFNVNTWENRIPTNDRASNSNKTCSTSNFGSWTNSEKVEAVAFYMHDTDLRSEDYENTIQGSQNITLFTVYAFGDGSGTKTLQMGAKYGGFENTNGNLPTPNTWPSPDQQNEWDKAGNCAPYNFFEASDGAVLEANLYTAMTTILAKVSSGTAASILSNSEGSGANMLQAVFYPNKILENSSQVNWIGELQNLWYYVDPFINNSTVREDTDFTSTTPDHIMNLRNDYVAKFYFDDEQKTTRVSLTQDANGDGAGDTLISSSISPDAVKSIWRAGKLLWARSPSTRTIHTSVDGTSLLASPDSYGGFYSASTRAAALQPYLQAANNDSNAEAMKIINYIRGTDQTSYRNRKVSLTIYDPPLVPAPDLKEWKLGDIVASTPRIQSTVRMHDYNIASPGGYGDVSYGKFIISTNYSNRGMVYVGANDGMMHAFKMGKLTVSGTGVSGDVKATLTGTNLGEEQWAYIPRNALPYLKYLTDRDNYKHLYYVDGPTVLADVATAKPSDCTAPDYSDCVEDAAAGTNWKSVLIGSMGLGGASQIKATSPCVDGADGTCVKTPLYSVTDINNLPHLGLGYSSYFALDITNQYFDSGVLHAQPTLKWEFSHPALGYATSGAAIIKINATTTVDGVSAPDKTKNGKWFAVFASGPTGSIDTVAHQFLAKSDQNLKLFVVDLGATAPLVLNTSYWVIDTGIKRAFGGSVVNSVIDTDRWNKNAPGNYQDDALYVGYTKANIADTSPITGATKWTDGGVLRLLTKEDPNPNNWVVNPVITGVGPVTTSVVRLQDRYNHKLWLYFGTGRYYYSGDDPSSQRYLIGVQDRCYTTSDTLDKNCDYTAAPANNPEATGKGHVLSLSDLKDQTTYTVGSDVTTEKGWYITLDGEDVSTFLGSERGITDPVALTNGAVFFTTFKPTSDVCKFGGTSYLWGVTHNSGGTLPAAALKGKALVQVSTGSFEEINLKDALNDKNNRRMGGGMVGKPPAPPPPVISNANLKPIKRIMHMQER